MIQFKQNQFFNAEILERKRIYSRNMMTSRIGDIFLFIGAGISGDGEAEVVAGLGSGSPPPGTGRVDTALTARLNTPAPALYRTAHHSTAWRGPASRGCCGHPARPPSLIMQAAFLNSPSSISSIFSLGGLNFNVDTSLI